MTQTRIRASQLRALDNEKYFVGADDDASIYYDGTDLVINPKEVGSGYLGVAGDLSVTDKVYVGSTTGDAELNVGAYFATNNLGSNFRGIFNIGGVIFRGAANDNIILHSNSGNAELRVRADNGSVTNFQMNTGTYIHYCYGNITLNAGYTTDNGIITLGTAGNTNTVVIPTDNNKLLFGTGNDASIYYDGTDFVFDSREVGFGGYVFNGGNVGIGAKANVNAKLHIHDQIQTQCIVQLTNTETGSGAGDGFHILNIGTTAYLFNREAADIVFGPGNAESVRMKANGDTRFADNALYVANTDKQIGVGLDNPAYQFHIYHATDNILLALQSNDANVSFKLIDSTKEVDIENRAGKFMVFPDSGASNPLIVTDGKMSINRTYTTVPDEGLVIDGNIHLYNDNNKLLVGRGKDASISYDGTNLIIKSDEVGSGAVKTVAGRIVNTTRVTTTYTILTTDHHICCNTDGGDYTVTLPAGVDGQIYRIINTGSSGNVLTIAPDGAELLTGDNTSRTLSDKSVIILVYESTEGWW
ncbi:MAG: hypothetical protein DRP42_02755 [Tenericutes bacterium]|nr:MAG: hypothetical protein DRP42_02755 [Mycoplasmatota bacterium]